MNGTEKIVEIGESSVDDLAAGAERGETMVVAREGRPVAAVVSIEFLRRLVDERELLRRLALGELESAGGEGVELEAVLEDCRLLLEEN
jgi:hypothetical protein